MPTTMRMLVPVDFSDSSKAAVEYAVLLGERFGASIDILHVLEPSRITGPTAAVATTGGAGQASEELARASAGRAMEGFLAKLDRSPSVKTRSMVVPGELVETIVRIATLEKHDLVVLRGRGRTGLLQLVEGGKAELVVRLAPCPVVVVPG